MLAEATRQVAHMAIRNRGTVCGSVSHNDPSAEHPSVLVTMGGTVVIAGKAGRRELAAEEFFTGMLSNALEPGEMVVELRYPTAIGSDGIGICGIRSAAGRLCHRRRGGNADDARRRVRAGAAHHPRHGRGSVSRTRRRRRCSLGGAWVQKNARRLRRSGREGHGRRSIRPTMSTHLPRTAGISPACWPSALWKRRWRGQEGTSWLGNIASRLP